MVVMMVVVDCVYVEVCIEVTGQLCGVCSPCRLYMGSGNQTQVTVLAWQVSHLAGPFNDKIQIFSPDPMPPPVSLTLT